MKGKCTYIGEECTRFLPRFFQVLAIIQREFPRVLLTMLDKLDEIVDLGLVHCCIVDDLCKFEILSRAERKPRFLERWPRWLRYIHLFPKFLTSHGLGVLIAAWVVCDLDVPRLGDVSAQGYQSRQTTLTW
jgi:hypothetical protein